MWEKLASLDDYDRSARLAPGLLAILPVALVVIGSGVDQAPVVASLVAALLTFAAPLALAKYVRLRGRALEPRLYAMWGNPPTTELLIPNPDDSTTGPLQAKRRAAVERSASVALPNYAESQTDQGRERYLAAVSVLRGRAAANKVDHPIVYEENKNYGFERNLFAIKTESLAIALLADVVLAIGIVLTLTDVRNGSLWAPIVAFAICAVLTTFMAWWPTAERVRDAGTRYAEHLLDAASQM